jgi:two-component system NtrC family sensor kinase
MPVFIHFFHAYLGITQRKWILYTFYAYAFCLMWLSLTPFCIEKMKVRSFGFYGQGGLLYLLVGIGAAGAVFYGVSILLIHIRNEKRSIQKNKLKYILAGFGTLGVLNGLNVLPLLGYNVYPPGTFSFIPLSVFAVGLFKYDLLDMGIIVNKSLLYSITTTVFTGMYVLIVGTVRDAFQLSQSTDSIVFTILFFLLVVMGVGPTQSLVQRWIDRFFHRRTVEVHQRIKYISRLIVSSLNVDTIVTHLTSGVGRQMKIAHVAIFLKQSEHHKFLQVSSWHKGDRNDDCAVLSENTSLVRLAKTLAQPILKKQLLEKSADIEVKQVLTEMAALRAEVVLPLRIEHRCIGLLVLGEKTSGRLYRQEEIDLLFTLSAQVSLALENAKAYRRVDDLNKNLEKKVDERTFALQNALLEKEKSQEQLIRSESLAAIGQLVAGVAHELNNPLSAAISLIQTTCEDIEAKGAGKQGYDENQLKDDIRFAGKELNRAKQIVASLLCLSRQTNTYAESVNINRVTQNALKVLESDIKRRRIRVEEDYETGLPAIQGNFANLGQVAINIIKNACQAVRARGTIFVSTQYRSEANQVLFSCLDNGPGIPDFLRKDIFKPFFTTKTVGHGTGLGLYLCHEIIQKHRGTIVHENIQGHGALFKVYLPVAGRRSVTGNG